MTVRTAKDSFLSFSQVYTWLKCRQNWHYSYEKRLAPRVDRPQPSRGTAFHVGMSDYLRALVMGKTPDLDATVESSIHSWAEAFIEDRRDDLTQDEEDFVWTLAEEAIELVKRTVKHFEIDQGRWETLLHKGVPLVEFFFSIPIRGWKGFIGYIDWVARDRQTGLVWLVDWKVRDTFQPVDNEEVNLQSATYQYALIRLGIQVHGSLNIQVSSTLPQKPKLNKDGSMSRARIKTDWPTYRDALLEHGLDPDDYAAEMIPKLSDVEFWRESKAPRSLHELRETWKNVIQPVALDIARRQRRIYRNLSARTCVGCDFRMLCLEELRGGDAGYIQDTQYVVRPSKFDDDEVSKEETNADEVQAV